VDTFTSTQPHIDGNKPEDLEHGLFTLSNRASANCLYFSEQGFIGMHMGYGAPIYRLITFESQQLEIRDLFLGQARLLPMPDHMPAISPKYGFRLTTS
jgi:hypothetical protein